MSASRSSVGSIHALIGANGAGKTTCFNPLTKFLAPARPAAPSASGRAKAGCSGSIPARGNCWPRVGLQELADTPAVNLPYGRKRALEIATTLAMDPN